MEIKVRKPKRIITGMIYKIDTPGYRDQQVLLIPSFDEVKDISTYDEYISKLQNSVAYIVENSVDTTDTCNVCISDIYTRGDFLCGIRSSAALIISTMILMDFDEQKKELELSVVYDANDSVIRKSILSYDQEF